MNPKQKRKKEKKIFFKLFKIIFLNYFFFGVGVGFEKK